MLAQNTFTRRSLAMLTATAAMIVIAACGGDSDYGLGQRFPVSGTVTYNGQPLEKGQINFYPEDPKGTGANGTIENGAYDLSTVGDRDGARPGKYKVGIVSKEDSAARAKAEFEKAQSKSPHTAGNSNYNTDRIPPEFSLKAADEAKSLIPSGYGDLRTTTLKAEVVTGTNSLNFALSDAEAPPEPPKIIKGKSKAGKR